jgi:MYXO-CTERM domain-containing protein
MLGRAWFFSAGLTALCLCAPAARAADGGTDAGSDAGASAADVIATYCSEADLECATAPLFYSKTITLPIAFDLDTGWVPQGSSLQVRFYVKVPASTTVELDGALETTWPEAMTLATPGGTHGLLKFDYGLEVGAKAKIDTTLLNWEGNIPFVPQVDWHLKAETNFTPWAFPPNTASAAATSPKVRLFEVNLLDLVGIPSQISQGGLALDVQADLKATYQTDRIRIEPASVTETPIESEDGTTTRAFPGGAFVEYDVFPEGHVDYDGTLHLIPSFYASILTKDYTLPLVDIPVTFDVGKQDFVFDPVRVHVPLPDLEPVAATLDFGGVLVGEQKTLELDLSNIGEAKARATGFLGAVANDFSLPSAEVLIPSQKKATYSVTFTPTETGAQSAELTLVTNDPDQRFIKVTLLANGGVVGDGGVDAAPPDQSGDSGGCGCRTAPSGQSGSLAWASLALGLALARRRHRPR